MPFELSWEPDGVHRRYFGAVTVAERKHSFDLICGDERFDDIRYAITDYLAVEDYEITAKATEEIAAFHIAPLLTNPGIVMAAVVTDPHIVAAIEHFISLGFVDQPYRVFATPDAAREWITQTMAASASRSPRLSR